METFSATIAKTQQNCHDYDTNSIIETTTHANYEIF